MISRNRGLSGKVTSEGIAEEAKRYSKPFARAGVRVAKRHKFDPFTPDGCWEDAPCQNIILSADALEFPRH